MTDLQRIEVLLNQVKEIASSGPSKKADRLIAKKMSDISSIATTIALTYNIAASKK